LTSKDDDTDVKISDFGLAKMLDESQLTSTLCGTPMYVAPEILRGRTNPYGPKVDIWAVGVITYILLAGYPPFFDNDLAKLYRQIIDVDYEFDDEYWADISDEATEFIDSLLVPDPEERPTAAEALKHPWFDLAIAAPPSESQKQQRKAQVERLGSFLDQQREQQTKQRATSDASSEAYVDSGDEDEDESAE
jgi:serine/threonine protein kinase